MPKLPSLCRLTRASVRRSATREFLAALSACVALTPLAVQAHAIVVTARPAMGATVTPGKLDVRIDFNSRIDAKLSRLRLQRPDGSEVSVPLTTGREGNVLAGSAEVTQDGRWKVLWQVLSLDGHITRGEVMFSVRKKEPTP